MSIKRKDVSFFDPFVGDSRPEVMTLMARLHRAQSINFRRSQVERKNGFGAPGDLPLHIDLQTVLHALSCAVSRQDWDIVFEAMALVQEAEWRVRTAFENKKPQDLL